MHPDMEKAINLIDHQILELQKARRILVEAFGEKGSSSGSRDLNRPLPFSRKTESTRKQAIIKLLQEQGPLTRSEILQKSGFPLGTISTYLNDKTVFKSKEGKWHLIESIKEEKEIEKN
jgi:hypothetical protein